MDLVINFGLLVAVIIAVSQLIKQTESVSAKYVPYVNIAFGILSGVIYLDGSLKDNIMYGIIIGLSASGLFDLTKVKDKTKKI